MAVPTPANERPDRTEYYLGLAVAVSSRAECRGMTVGAVLVKDNRVISTGYNGTPEGWDNCTDGGACPRCDDRDGFGGSGNGYDKCICVHAEMNAIAAAARYGMPIDGSIAYVTNEPCLTCAKELVQAGVAEVYYAIAAPPITQPRGRAQRKHLEETRTRFLGQLNARQARFGPVTKGLLGAIETFESEAQKREPSKRPTSQADTAKSATVPKEKDGSRRPGNKVASPSRP